MSALLPTLRGVIEAQVKAFEGGGIASKSRVVECLELILVSRVFDLDGLWEVLDELDGLSRETEAKVKKPSAEAESSSRPKTEIQDSDDDEPGLSPPPELGASIQCNSPPPDIIIITHMSSILNSHFGQHEKDTAHKMLQILSSRLHCLTRCPELGGPLIFILNSTNSSSFATGQGPTRDLDTTPWKMQQPSSWDHKQSRPPDPTLRSIFLHPAPFGVSGPEHGPDTSFSRHTKPSFGLIFTQLLDMHLLCTREDEQAPVHRAWVVEVLLDDVGVWEPSEVREGGRARRSGEQRWGAVDVVDGRRIVDAFHKRGDTSQVGRAAAASGPWA